MGNFACSCGDGMGNLGYFDCTTVAGLSKRDIFVPTYDSDGNKNSIKASDLVAGVLPASFIAGKLDNSDGTKRWFMTPNQYEEQAPARTEKQTYTTQTGSIYNLRNGVITYSSELIGVGFEWSGKINEGSCSQWSVFIVDEEGKISGESSADGSELYPLEIQKSSLVAETFPATPSKPIYTALSYQLSDLANEGRFLTLGADQIEGDLLKALSPIDAVVTQGTGTNTATNIFVKLDSECYGTFNNRVNITGATVTTDWTVLDGATSIVPDAVVELGNLEYQITIASTPTASLSVSYATTRTVATSRSYISNTATITTP